MNTQTLTAAKKPEAETMQQAGKVITVQMEKAPAKIFSAADMWNIQRQRRSFNRRHVA